MKRWHEEISITRRNWKKHRSFHVEANIRRSVVGVDPFEVDCACDDQIGRFRKKDAFDCGNTQCYICHSDKYPKREKTYQEHVSDMKFKEGLEEI